MEIARSDLFPSSSWEFLVIGDIADVENRGRLSTLFREESASQKCRVAHSLPLQGP